MPRRDYPFEAFRASNPVDESTVPGPESPKARALLAEITATPRTQPGRLTRYSRRRLAVAIAVALLAMASIAAAWLILRDVSDPLSVACYQAATLDSDVAVGAPGDNLDVTLCEPAWEDGTLVNDDIAPAGQVPDLVGCVTDQGNLAVFPSDSRALCTELGLASLNPESVPEGNVLRQLDTDLVEHSEQHECQPIAAAEQDVRQILDSYGLEDWQIRVSRGAPGRSCASYGLDIATETVRLIPIPPAD